MPTSLYSVESGLETAYLIEAAIRNYVLWKSPGTPLRVSETLRTRLGAHQCYCLQLNVLTEAVLDDLKVAGVVRRPRWQVHHEINGYLAPETLRNWQGLEQPLSHLRRRVTASAVTVF